MQPEICLAGVFDFLTSQEPEGYQGVEFSEGKIKGPMRGVNAPERLGDGPRSHNSREKKIQAVLTDSSY